MKGGGEGKKNPDAVKHRGIRLIATIGDWNRDDRYWFVRDEGDYSFDRSMSEMVNQLISVMRSRS